VASRRVLLRYVVGLCRTLLSGLPVLLALSVSGGARGVCSRPSVGYDDDRARTNGSL
jgi:hypothetical protein